MINKCRKWTLFGLCITQIVFAIIGLALINTLNNAIDNAAKQQTSLEPEKLEEGLVNNFSLVTNYQFLTKRFYLN